MVTPIIHIVVRFDVPWSGSSLSALALHALLAPHARAELWSLTPPHPLYRHHPIRMISPEAGSFPRGGTLVIHGGHYELGDWVRKVEAARLIVLCNVHWPEQFLKNLVLLREAGLPDPDLAFRSRALRDQVAMEGIIEPPLIDLDAFRPATRASGDPFTLGRHGREVIDKHSGDDPSLYRMLALAGCRIRIMGGECLENHLGPDRAGIELLDAGSLPAHRFLQGLDCFFYRTGLVEDAFGRVVLEAMATGLPAVCHRRGGHADWIRSGENGFLFDTQEEAFDLLMALRDDLPMRRRLGDAARGDVEAMLGAAALEARRKWYLAPGDG